MSKAEIQLDNNLVSLDDTAKARRREILSHQKAILKRFEKQKQKQMRNRDQLRP